MKGTEIEEILGEKKVENFTNEVWTWCRTKKIGGEKGGSNERLTGSEGGKLTW